jgi:dynein light intermediate chain
MTIAAYQTLYESSIAFGMRKALMAEQRKVPTNNQYKLLIFYFLPFLLLPIQAEMEAKIKHLESDKKDLERQVQDLMNRCDAIEKREQERRAADEKKHAEEVLVKKMFRRAGYKYCQHLIYLLFSQLKVDFLKKTNEQLKSNLESLLSTPKK